MNKKLHIAILLLISIFVFSGCSSGGTFRTIKDIKRSGVLNVYVNPASEPFAYMDGAQPAGLEVELMETLASELGVMPIFIVSEPAEIYAAVQSGEADIAVGQFINAAGTRSVVLFSEGTGSQGLFSVAPRGEIYNTCGTFQDKHVGVVDGSASEYAMVISPIRPAEIVYYENILEATTGLLKNEIHVLLCSEPEAASIAAEHAEFAAEYVTNAAVVEFSAMLARGNNAPLDSERLNVGNAA